MEWWSGLGRAVRVPAQVALGTAVVGISGARLTTAAARTSAGIGFSVARAAGTAAVGAGVVATAGAVETGARTVSRVASGVAGVAAVAGTVLTVADRSLAVAGTLLTSAERAVEGVERVGDGVRTVRQVVPELVDPRHGRHRRRVWAERGRCHVELHSESVEEDPQFADELARQLRRLDGVSWTRVSDVLGRVLVVFDDGRLSAADVVDVVAAVERARGHDGHPFDPERPDHPADVEPVVAAAVQLAADLVSVALAGSARFVLLPRAPRALHVLLALTDGQPRVRARVEHRLGPLGTELAFGLLRAGLHAATQRPTSMVFDAGQRVLRLRELSARRAAWQRREAELHRAAPDPEGAGAWPPPSRRPVPLPPGPIESYAERIALGSLPFAALTLALTRRPARAAEALHAAVPRAARVGREVFATLVGAEVSRRGVVALDGSVWRRLDRVDTVVVDSAGLGTGGWTVLQALSCNDGWSDARIWSASSALLHRGNGEEDPHAEVDGALRLEEHPELPGATGARIHGLYEHGRQVGFVTVGPRLDPYADALLDAARAADARLLMTDHATATDLLGRADEVVDGSDSLVGTVRGLQEQGAVVLLVSAADGPALAAADVGVGLLRGGSAPAWGADLLCGPGLRDAVHVLAAVPVARAVSERSVRYAAAGTTLAWLVTLAGPTRRRRPTVPGRSRLPSIDPPLAAVASALLTGAWSARALGRRPEPAPTDHVPWHALEADEVLRLTRQRRATDQRDAQGSTTAPAAQRVRGVPGMAPVLRFSRVVADELRDPLTPVLAVGATASAMLGSPTDAVLVGAVMTGNALLSAVQRLRAEAALGELLAEQDAPAHRETDGRVQDVSADDLRVGDVLVVGDGDVVPADARMIETSGLEVDESTLTGESLPVAKTVAATPAADLPERSCMLHQGTTVVSGSGRAVVVAVGAATVAGRTADVVAGAAPPVGLQTRLAELTRTTLPLSLLGGAAVSAFGLLRRQALRPAVAGGVAVAVAAVPEGLPLVATVAQTAVARRLSRRGAVVRSAGVTEALGRIDTICFDKTGTLTENRLALAGVFDPGGRRLESSAADRVLALARAATPDGTELPHATDRAVVAAADERELDPLGDRRTELPFTASRGFSAGLLEPDDADGAALLSVKGAPEIVVERCAGLGPEEKEATLRTARELAGRGLRVLAVATRSGESVPAAPPAAATTTAGTVSAPPAPTAEELEAGVHGLELQGFVTLTDRLRPGAPQALRRLRAAGVRPVVITGDHPETAAAIAGELGIDTSSVLTGAELTRLPEDQRADAARRTSVFARVSPEQKVAVVRSLRRSGAVLAMVGDGVNDAAAIRMADVGIGIGIGTVESASARAVAHIVLADNDLGAVVDAVGEGRAMWSSVRDAVAILVGGNAGEIAFSLLGTVVGGRSPINTRQFLLVNLLTDAFPALAVAVSPPRPGAPDAAAPVDELTGTPFEAVLRRGPQAGFSTEVRRAVLARAATTGAGASAAWLAGRLTGPSARAGTMGLAALVGTQLAQTALVRRRSPLVLLTVLASVVVLIGVVQLPPLSLLFGCVPLDPVAWGVVLAASLGATAASVLVPPLLTRMGMLTASG